MKFLISTGMRTADPMIVGFHGIPQKFPQDIHPESAYIDIDKMRWSVDRDKFFPDPYDALFTPVMTEYVCSHCGERIPITNVFVFRQTWLQQLLGIYPIAGFWCPRCGDPWTRCERIPPKITITG